MLLHVGQDALLAQMVADEADETCVTFGPPREESHVRER